MNAWRGGHFNGVVVGLIGGWPCELMNRVIGFQKSCHSLPMKRNTWSNWQFAMAVPMARCLKIWRAKTTKRRVKIKLLLHHQPQGSNPNWHTIQGAHGGLLVGACVSNTGPGLAISEDAPLRECCCYPGNIVTFVDNVCFLVQNRSIDGWGAE